MKDFIKWLGVDEKIAKVAVWALIIMVLLIIFNTFLDSIGVPYYKLSVDNLSKINTNMIIEYVCAYIMSFLNFMSVVLLVFRVKETKKILKYAILYLAINAIIAETFNYTIAEVLITLLVIIFCYFYSGRKWKYALYAIGSFIINAIIQYVMYIYKIQFVDYNAVNSLGKLVLSIDYYLILALIIAVKEIYLKRRGDK
jgi:hypothetical protein